MKLKKMNEKKEMLSKAWVKNYYYDYRREYKLFLFFVKV